MRDKTVNKNVSNNEMSTWRQVISPLTLKIEFQTTYVNIFKKKSCLFFSLFLIEINDSPFVSMSTQQSERVSHDRAVSFSSRGLSYSYTQRYYYYVQRKKETCHVGKYLYYLFLFECAKGNCVRVRTTSIITFMCQQLSFVVSFLSWVNEKKQQPTWPLFTRANADKVILFLQKQTSKLMKLKFQLTNIWEECSGNLNNTHSNMAEICTHK